MTASSRDGGCKPKYWYCGISSMLCSSEHHVDCICVGPTVPCSFCLSSLSRILDTITIVRSETVVRWHRMKNVTLPSAEQALPPVHHYHDGVLVALDILEGRRYRLMPPSCPTNVSRRTGRASGPLPQLASSAVPEAEALLPADPHASTSGEQTCHPGIRVRRDAPVVRPC